MGKAVVRLMGACAGVVAIESASSAWAIDKSWAAKSGGNFERATSWSPRGAPGVNDRAIFDLVGRKGATASYTVKFNSDPTNLSAWMKLGVVTWDLNGHTYTLTSPTESLRAGMAGASSDLQVNDGILNTVTVVSGGTSGLGSLGSRFGIGLDATWNNSSDVVVGQ